jgi:hypothetical protein
VGSFCFTSYRESPTLVDVLTATLRFCRGVERREVKILPDLAEKVGIVGDDENEVCNKSSLFITYVAHEGNSHGRTCTVNHPLTFLVVATNIG